MALVGVAGLRLDGLTRAELNGQPVEVERWDEERGRYVVRLPRSSISVKPQNIVIHALRMDDVQLARRHGEQLEALGCYDKAVQAYRTTLPFWNGVGGDNLSVAWADIGLACKRGCRWQSAKEAYTTAIREAATQSRRETVQAMLAKMLQQFTTLDEPSLAADQLLDDPQQLFQTTLGDLFAQYAEEFRSEHIGEHFCQVMGFDYVSIQSRRQRNRDFFLAVSRRVPNVEAVWVFCFCDGTRGVRRLGQEEIDLIPFTCYAYTGMGTTELHLSEVRSAAAFRELNLAGAQEQFSGKTVADEVDEKLQTLTVDAEPASSSGALDELDDPAFLAGATVIIHGLQARQDLNGKTGVAASFDASSGRYHVTVEGETTLLVKSANLTAVAVDSTPTPGAASPASNAMVMYSYAVTPLGRLDLLINARGFDAVCPTGTHLASVHASFSLWQGGIQLLLNPADSDVDAKQQSLCMLTDALWATDQDTSSACAFNVFVDGKASSSSTVVQSMLMLCRGFQTISSSRDVVANVRSADLMNADQRVRLANSIRAASLEAFVIDHGGLEYFGRQLNHVEFSSVLDRARQAAMLRYLLSWRAIEQLSVNEQPPAPWEAIENATRRGSGICGTTREQRDTAIMLLRSRCTDTDLVSCIASPGIASLHLGMARMTRTYDPRMNFDDLVHGACRCDADFIGVLQYRAACHFNNGMLIQRNGRLPPGSSVWEKDTGYYAAFTDYFACARLASKDGSFLADGFFWEAANSLGHAGGRDGNGVPVKMLKELRSKAVAAHDEAGRIYLYVMRNAQAIRAVKDVLRASRGEETVSRDRYRQLAQDAMSMTEADVGPHLSNQARDLSCIGCMWLPGRHTVEDDTSRRWKTRSLALMRCGHCGKRADYGAEDLQQCSRCKSVSYCSVECQKAHFSAVHKLECKEMKRQLDAERAAEGIPDGIPNTAWVVKTWGSD